MRGANKSVQDLNYKYFNNFFWPRNSRAAFEAARFRPPAARDSVGTLNLGPGVNGVHYGDVTMTKWSR